MKNSRTNIESRQNTILRMLQQRKKMTVDEIAEALNVTSATIRRDLIHLNEP